MRKVVDYKLVSIKSYFLDELKKALGDGYEPYGNPTACASIDGNDWNIWQAMVKYEEEVKDDKDMNLDTNNHPQQPTYIDDQGVLRFKENEICRYLIDHGNIDLNDLARLHFKREDRQQFAQLIGYSVSGYGGLSYVCEE